MGNSVSAYIANVRKDHRTQLKLLGVLLALAVIVVGVVFWQLRYTGVAMANETYCGYEEHVHGEECYEEGVLVCEKEEHVHTVQCVSDESADTETSAEWEETLPELSGNWAEDVAAIAESQLGYTESENNFMLSDDGETRRGYTRYGAWYGSEYGTWDAMFASFCLSYANVPIEAFPESSGAFAWVAELKEEGIYREAEEYTPAGGDIAFLDADGDGRAEKAAVVTMVSDTEITVIEGDYEDAVSKNTYTIEEGTIIGYGELPDEEEYGIQPLAANGELTIFKYDSEESEFGGYFEGYVAFVPAGTYYVCYDMNNNNVETGLFFYVGQNYFVVMDDEENWYEATYEATEWVAGTKSDAAMVVVEATEEVDGVAGSYVYYKFDDNAHHDNYKVYLIDADVAPETTGSTNLAEVYAGSMYGFDYYELSTEASGALSGAVFTLYGEHAATAYSEGYGGYFYFTVSTDDDGETIYSYAGYLELQEGQELSDDLLQDGQTFFIESGSDGNINIVNLPTDSLTLTLSEVSAPEGYDKMEDLTFDYQGFGGTVSVDEEETGASTSDGTISVPNEPAEIAEVPTYSLEVYKYAATAAESESLPLAGAEFTLSYTETTTNEETGVDVTVVYYAQFTDDQGTGYTVSNWVTNLEEAGTVSSGEDGKINIDGLPAGEYALTETEAPEGYELLEESVSFAVSESGEIIFGGETTEGALEIENEVAAEETYSLDVFKYGKTAANEESPLSGAEFIISKTEVTTDEGTGDETETTLYAVFTTTGEGEAAVTTVEWAENIEEATVLTSGEDGYIHTEGLEKGTYSLTETEAPDGYMLLDKEIEFTLSAEGSIELLEESEITAVNEDGAIAVENIAGVELPSTGGNGIIVYTIAGVALLGGVAGLMYKNKKRRVRDV